MIQENVQVLYNRSIGPSYFRIGLTCHLSYLKATPGQFIMLRVPDRSAPLLNRPFSIHRPILSNKGIDGIEILYKVIGDGTRAISLCEPGDKIALLGPLGRGFEVSDTHRRIVIAAGGIGIAPMVFLASVLVRKGIDPNDCTVFIGGRSKADLLCMDAFIDLNMQLRTTTEDGSEGEPGLITALLEAQITKNPPDIIFACGPVGMLKQVIEIANRHGVACQVSIETMMACGMGACLGCAVENRNRTEKYWHACMDGPVFDAETIVL